MARRVTLTLPIIGLVALLLLTGCMVNPFGGPSEQEQPVTLVLNNSANNTQTFTVWVVEGEISPDKVKIYKQNGEVDGASPGEGLYTAQFSEEYGYVTAVEPPANRSRLHGQFNLSPNERHTSTVENFSIGSTIVVSLSENGRVLELNTANCDELALVGLEVASRQNPPGGASASYGCR